MLELDPRSLLGRLSYWATLATAACVAAGSASGQPACDLEANAGDPVVLAELQVWHGMHVLDSGCFGPSQAYDSRNLDVIGAQIEVAKTKGIDGFVIDWYGPGPVDWPNDADREFMDVATAHLFEVAEGVPGGFCLALMYDEGTVGCGGSACPGAMDRATADLAYADATYLSSPAYLALDGKPAVFVFPYPEIDPDLDWAVLRAAMSTHQVTLIDEDPNPDDPTPHDTLFDGFFAWVQPGAAGWDPLGLEWGGDYLQWFYQTLASTNYEDKLAVGGVWPGFDDLLAPWTESRFMSRAGGDVYQKTWDLATAHGAGVVMIATWNDYEEGTDIEAGIQMVVDMQAAEANAPEVLTRSSPLAATWQGGEGAFQLYHDCQLICDQLREPAVPVANLESGEAYELKLWLSPEPLPRTVLIRSPDPHPAYIFDDGFESGDLGAWSSSAEKSGELITAGRRAWIRPAEVGSGGCPYY